MTPEPTALLRLRQLTISAGERTLVRDLSVDIRAGETWCILGANGAGKTMLLNTVVGLRKPAAGHILLEGHCVHELAPLAAARLRAYLPQTVHDVFSARVLDLVVMGRHPYLSRWSWESAAESRMALRALEEMELAHMAQRDVTTLSGGERQRVAIAALLVQQAPLLLLDEPVAHLDLHHQITILKHLASLAAQGNRAVVYSMHDLNLAARFATHAILYRDGGTVDHGPIEDVMTEAALSRAFHHPVTRVSAGERSIFMPT